MNFQFSRTLSHMSGAASRPSNRRGGFTLVELIIVIGLILLLVAITVSVSVGMLRQSEARETQNVLMILDNALEEWLMHGRDSVSYGINGEPCPNVDEVYQLPQLGAPNAHQNLTDRDAARMAQRETDFLIAALLRRAEFEQMITSIDSKFIRRIDINDPPDNLDTDLSHFTDGSSPYFNQDTVEYIYRFVDAWDRPILAIMPGRVYSNRCSENASYFRDADGTIRTPLENIFGVADNRRIYFVSAGQSERFGHLHLHVTYDDLTDAQQARVQFALDNIYSYPVITDGARP
jgi:prepilin-type N-terminal cleavage/methylation domain-containing protein